MGLIKKLLNRKETTSSRLVLYRLDYDNILLRDERNISGMAVGVHKDHIDAMSIKFYQYIEKSLNCDALTVKNLQMYKLYNRQVKLKLAGILRCAYRIKNFSDDVEGNIEIITDRQTVCILKEAFLFLDYAPKNITWKSKKKHLRDFGNHYKKMRTRMVKEPGGYNQCVNGSEIGVDLQTAKRNFRRFFLAPRKHDTK